MDVLTEIFFKKNFFFKNFFQNFFFNGCINRNFFQWKRSRKIPFQAFWMRKAAGFINHGCIKRILLHCLYRLFVVLNRLLQCTKKTSPMHPLLFYLHFLCIFPRPSARKKNKVGQAFLSEPFFCLFSTSSVFA